MDRSSASDASPGNSGSVATLNGLSAAGGFPSSPDPLSLFAIPDWMQEPRRPTASSSLAPRHTHVSSTALEDPHSLFGMPATRARRPTESSSLAPRHTHVSSSGREDPQHSLSLSAMPDTRARRSTESSSLAPRQTHVSSSDLEDPHSLFAHVSTSGLEGMFESLRTNSHLGSRPHESPSALPPVGVARVPLAADLMPEAPCRRARKRKTRDPQSEASSMLPPLVGQASSAASTATHTYPPSARRVSTRISRSPFDAEDSVFENSSRKRKASPDRKTPPHKKRAPAKLKADPDEDVNTEHDSTCCICITEPEPADLASINGCEHMFCFGCIEKWADRENTCPLCKKRFTKIDRVNKTKKRAVKSSKKVKNRSQRLEMTHSVGLEGLFGELGRSGIAIESIFSRLGGSRFNAHIARIVVNGIGGGSVFEAQLDATPRPFAFSQSSAPPFAFSQSSAPSFGFPQSSAPPSVPEAAGIPPRLEDVFFGSDDDDEDDVHNDEGYNGFVASIRNMESMRGGGPTWFGIGPRARSFASNVNDVDAGETADNALEIDDSDDEVEVVRVSRGGNL